MKGDEGMQDLRTRASDVRFEPTNSIFCFLNFFPSRSELLSCSIELFFLILQATQQLCIHGRSRRCGRGGWQLRRWSWPIIEGMRMVVKSIDQTFLIDPFGSLEKEFVIVNLFSRLGSITFQTLKLILQPKKSSINKLLNYIKVQTTFFRLFLCIVL